LMREAGYTVSGSDVKPSHLTEQLVAMGCSIHIGHAAGNLPPAPATVVISTAVPADNAELQAARLQGYSIIHRSDLLQALLQGKPLGHPNSVGVIGTHGKTSITGMAGLVLIAAGLNPTVIAGGLLPGLNTNALWGGAERQWVVAELDESDQSFLLYRPTYTIFTNLEMDHPDHYPGGFAQMIQLFEQYFHQLPTGCTVIFNQDCPESVRVLERAGKHLKIIPVSLKGSPDGYAVYHPSVSGLGYTAKVLHREVRIGQLTLNVPGRHNLMNALQTVALAHHIGVPIETVQTALEAFTGMGRRFERVGQHNEAWLIDDYGHHPTEVKATLKAAKELSKRVTVVFQPHRYSRLASLWADFCHAFTDADRVFITDVYAAGENPLPDFNAEALARELQAEYLPKTQWDAMRQLVLNDTQPGEIVLSMGAGDITQLFRTRPVTATV
jgi:UDP-N-acetylmuramate--alanine ligase